MNLIGTVLNGTMVFKHKDAQLMSIEELKHWKTGIYNLVRDLLCL